jgi:hypothetical protein
MEAGLLCKHLFTNWSLHQPLLNLLLIHSGLVFKQRLSADRTSSLQSGLEFSLIKIMQMDWNGEHCCNSASGVAAGSTSNVIRLHGARMPHGVEQATITHRLHPQGTGVVVAHDADMAMIR